MKRKIFIVVSIVILFSAMLLSSCFGNGKYDFKFDYTYETEGITQLLEVMGNKDKEGLKAMFAKTALAKVDNFDESVDELFDYYQGTFISRKRAGSYTVASTRNGETTRRIDYSYDVVTSDQTYRIAVYHTVVDTANPDDMGILSLYILKMEDDPAPRYTYWGDGHDTAGINVAAKGKLNDFLLEYILKAIEEKNETALTDLFAPNSIKSLENFNESINSLFDYYEGNKISYKQMDAVVKESPSYAPNDEQIDVTFDIKTDKQSYRIAFRTIEFIGNKHTKDNYGIRSLYIIKEEEDTDLSVPYWGDGQFTPGIHIGVKNVIPE